MDEEKRGPGRPKKTETIPCVVLKDYWPRPEDIEAGWPTNPRNRVKAGIVIELTAEAAMGGLEAGLIRRAKEEDLE